MPKQGSLSVEQMCRLSGVSRAGCYRSLQERMPVDEDMEVRSAIQQIAVEHRRRYGYRRIAAELRRRGMLVNHKRLAGSCVKITYSRCSLHFIPAGPARSGDQRA
jgi:hypothetical protein